LYSIIKTIFDKDIKKPGFLEDIHFDNFEKHLDSVFNEIAYVYDNDELIFKHKEISIEKIPLVNYNLLDNRKIYLSESVNIVFLQLIRESLYLYMNYYKDTLLITNEINGKVL
jgi:hypothetical protein